MARRGGACRADNYYWMTAALAARGVQSRSCCVIAVTIVGLGAGVLPLMANAGRVGDTSQHLLIATMAGTCVLTATLWMRNRWPSRMQSRLGIATVSVCIAVGCLTALDPAIGLLGATSFSLVGAYITLFDCQRVLLLAWVIGGVTLAVLAARLIPVSATLAVAGVTLVVVLNIMTAIACRAVLRLFDTGIQYREIEPLTGLLSRLGFEEDVATLICARSRIDDRYLVVLVISLERASRWPGAGGAADDERARIAIAQRLRETIRRGTVLAHGNQQEFLIADVFTKPDPGPLAERIRGTISSAPFGLTASIGVVSTPLRPLATHPPGEVVERLLTVASAAMRQAREIGGNQFRHALHPAVTTLDEPSTERRSAV